MTFKDKLKKALGMRTPKFPVSLESQGFQRLGPVNDPCDLALVLNGRSTESSSYPYWRGEMNDSEVLDNLTRHFSGHYVHDRQGRVEICLVKARNGRDSPYVAYRRTNMGVRD